MAYVPYFVQTIPKLDGVAATTSVDSTITTDTTLVPADAGRRGLIIYNDSTSVLWVLMGPGTESATVFSFKMLANSFLEVPWGYAALRFSGHWTTANGTARFTSLT